MRLGKDVLEADLYGDLGLLPDATDSELRVAYRRRARESHPDLNQLDPHAVPRMKRLNVAARVLLDPALRRAYDNGRRAPSRKRSDSTRPRPSAWFERSERSHDNDWAAAPAPRTDLRRSTRFAGFLSELRGRDGKLSLQLDELIRSLTSREQIAVTALLIAVAVGLIAMARPHSLGGGPPNAPQPSSVSAGMLFP